MGLVHGSGKFDRYEMSDEFSLQKANRDAWEVFCSIYYNAEYHSYSQEMLYKINLDREPYWIYQGLVLPSYSKRGIGSNMLKRVLTMLTIITL
ncbi:MAG TPA: hypothetical protein VGI33_20995 [Paenibacillus sp.]|jgi:hypothetical protein